MHPNRYDDLWHNHGWLKCNRCGHVERPLVQGGSHYPNQLCIRRVSSAVNPGILTDRCLGHYVFCDKVTQEIGPPTEPPAP